MIGTGTIANVAAIVLGGAVAWWSGAASRSTTKRGL